jgi:hypothetical protein
VNEPHGTTREVTHLTCEECRRPWHDHVERWRMYLTDDEPPIAVAYCPACAEREFGG